MWIVLDIENFEYFHLTTFEIPLSLKYLSNSLVNIKPEKDKQLCMK